MKKITTMTLVTAIILAMTTSCSQAKPEEPGTTKEPSSEGTSRTTWVITDPTELTSDPDDHDQEEDPDQEETDGHQKGEGPTAFWIDSNMNFSHDPDDYYYTDFKQVSMSEYYETLKDNMVYQIMDALSTIGIGPDPANHRQDECDYVTIEKVSLIVNGDDGEDEKITGYVPHIDIDSADAGKVNKEIKNTLKKVDFSWGGTPETKYIHIERDDGSKTVIWFYNEAEDRTIRSYTFDRDGNLMTADDILKSAGIDKEEFMKKAAAKLQQDLDLSQIWDLHDYGPVDNVITMESFYKDPDIFINEQGQVAAVLRMEGNTIPLYSDFIYSFEFEIKAEDKINVCDESKNCLTELREEVEDYLQTSFDIMNYPLDLLYSEEDGDTMFNSRTSIEDVDVTTPSDPDDMREYYYFGTDTVNGYLSGYDLNSELYCRLVFATPERENGSYKYEVYRYGKVVLEGKVTCDNDNYFQTVEFKCKPEKEGTYCVIVYDRDLDDMGLVLARGWFDVYSEE